MKKKSITQYVVCLLFVALFALLLPGQFSKLYSSQSSVYIEVCANGPVYVPPGTVYVLCNGKKKKVLKIEPYVPGKTNCYCPKCCSGSCAIIIECEPRPEKYNEELSYKKALKNTLKKSSDLCLMWIIC